MQVRQKKRLQLGIIVSRATKTTIEALARDSGRSQGQICEELIEKGLTYDRTLTLIRDELAEMRKNNEKTRLRRLKETAGNLEADLPKLGYTPVHSDHGIIWYPPGYPPDYPAPLPDPLSEEEAARATRRARIKDARRVRDLEERIARLEALANGEQK